ncbi:hypothetical protein ACTFIZ_007103 [Dictyostelium cf. discoideum]
MLLKLVLIFCLLISLSWAINVEVESYTYSKDAGMPDKLVHSSSVSSGSGGSGGSGSSGTSSGCGSSSGTGYNDGDTTVNDGVTYKSSELKENLQETGCYSTGENDTGTGSGRSSTTVNDGVTYKATDILQAKTSTTYYY